MDNNLNEWKSLALSAWAKVSDILIDGVLNLLGIILIFVIGVWLIRLFSKLLLKFLQAAKIDKFSDKINEAGLFGDTGYQVNLSQVIVSFFKAIMYLIILTVAADVMNLSMVSQEIGKLLAYLPKLFSAIALFLIGLYIAGLIKKGLLGFLHSVGFAGAGLISSIVFFIILVLFIITALNQAGIDTEIISSNLTFIIIAFLMIMVISLGIGSIDVIRNMMLTHYVRKNFLVGEKISVPTAEGELKGDILKIEDLYITLQTGDRKLVIPIKEFSNMKVQKLNS